jgi:hypothetical protein
MDHPLSYGLVGCWLFNEGAGVTAYDSSGKGNHGTLNGFANPSTAPTSGWGAGPNGMMLWYDGSNDYVQVPSSPSMDIVTNGTMIINLCGPGGANKYLLSKLAADFAKRFYWYDNGTVLLFVTKDDTPHASESLDALIRVPDSTFHMFAYEAGTTPFLWQDGIKVDTASTTFSFTEQAGYNLQIGAFTGWSTYWLGGIDFVYFYNRPLTATEHQELVLNPFVMFEEYPNQREWVLSEGIYVPYYYTQLLAGEGGGR